MPDIKYRFRRGASARYSTISDNSVRWREYWRPRAVFHQARPAPQTRRGVTYGNSPSETSDVSSALETGCAANKRTVARSATTLESAAPASIRPETQTRSASFDVAPLVLARRAIVTRSVSEGTGCDRVCPSLTLRVMMSIGRRKAPHATSKSASEAGKSFPRLPKPLPIASSGLFTTGGRFFPNGQRTPIRGVRSAFPTALRLPRIARRRSNDYFLAFFQVGQMPAACDNQRAGQWWGR